MLRGDLNILHPFMLHVDKENYLEDLILMYHTLGIYALDAEFIILKHILPVLKMDTQKIFDVRHKLHACLISPLFST